MPFMTPHGLKIRLEFRQAFSLLARLWVREPKTDAFRVLKTCEAIGEIPSVLALVCGLIAVFFPYRPLWTISVAIIAGRLLGFILTQAGLRPLRPRGLVLAGLVWSYPLWPLWPLLLIHGPVLVLLFARYGWVVPLLWVAGYAGASLVCLGVQFRLGKWRYERSGVLLTPSEVDFFNAYLFHAERLGVTSDLGVSEQELAGGDWKKCFCDYALKYPEAVVRFAGPRWLNLLVEPGPDNMDTAPNLGSADPRTSETETN